MLYTYNANGIRTSKTIGGVKHTYILDGAKVLYEKWGDNVLSTLWDNEDSLCGIRYADESYFFLKNLQGDIIAITDKDGAVVARYSYDAWGVPTIVNDTSAVGIATINPFRYRGYYYDSEMQLYYLQSRYYNPVLGRFVNADEAIYLNTTLEVFQSNLFIYCENSPLVYTDHSGFDSDYITNQRDEPYGSMKLAGNYTVGQMGCGAVALYNVLHSYSKNVNFKNMLRKLLITPPPIGLPNSILSATLYLLNQAYNVWGKFGVSVFSIISYLQTKFRIVIPLFGFTESLWKRVAEKSGAVIIAYWRKTNGHYVACINTGEGGQAGGAYRIYNQSGFDHTKTYSILDFIKWMKDKGYTPLCMLGVRSKMGGW